MVAGAPGAIVTVVELRVKNGPLLPAGVMLALSVIVPVNPLVLLIVMVVVLELPCLTIRFEGLTEIVKSGGSLAAHWTLVRAEVFVPVAFDVTALASVMPTDIVGVVIVALVFVAVELDGPVSAQPGLIFPLASSLTTPLEVPAVIYPPSEVCCTELVADEAPPFSQTILPMASSLKIHAPPGELVVPTTMYPPSEVRPTA